jgi:hypothetical protein
MIADDAQSLGSEAIEQALACRNRAVRLLVEARSPFGLLE